MIDKKKEFFRGLKLSIPVILGFIPVGIAYAIMANQAGFTILETVLMSFAVFAGASQMMAVGMYAQGTAIIAIIFTTLILNLRHLIMSTCVVNKMKKTKVLIKLLAVFGVTDETFSIYLSDKEEGSIWTFFGLFLGAYLSWILGSLIGAVTSSFLPVIIMASFGIALYAMFIGILMPSLTKNIKLTLLIIMTAALNTILSIFIDSSLSLIISTLVCAFIGIFFVDLQEDKNEN